MCGLLIAKVVNFANIQPIAVRIDERGYAEIWKNRENVAPWDKPGTWDDSAAGKGASQTYLLSTGGFRLLFANPKTGMLLECQVSRQGDIARQVGRT
jgi:hypothetical protein